MSLSNENIIPNFISASSPLGLRRAMLLNNKRRGTTFKYFDFSKDGKRWIAWYYDDNPDRELIQSVNKELMSGD